MVEAIRDYADRVANFMFTEGKSQGKREGKKIRSLQAGAVALGLVALGVEERKLGYLSGAYNWAFGCATVAPFEDYRLVTPMTERGVYKIAGPVTVETHGSNQELVCTQVSYYTNPDAHVPVYTGIRFRFRKKARQFFNNQTPAIADTALTDQRFTLTIDHNPERASVDIHTVTSPNQDQHRPIIIRRDPNSGHVTIAVDDQSVINYIR